MNITEKEQQIQLMAQIYAKARSVIVWLGEATTAGSEDALLGVRGGWLPLKWAIDDGDMVVARLLLYYADPDAEIGHGLTPLPWASKYGYDLVVKLLLNTGKVDLNSQNQKGETPLLLAARRGYDTVVKKLLDTGNVDPNASDVCEDTPLLVAVYGNHVAVVRLLLETGKADPNVKRIVDKGSWIGQTPPIYASRNGHLESVRLLLESHGLDINFLDEHGGTACEQAFVKGHKEIYNLIAARLDKELREDLERGQLALRRKIEEYPSEICTSRFTGFSKSNFFEF